MYFFLCVHNIVKNCANWFVLDFHIQLPGVFWANVNSPETAKWLLYLHSTSAFIKQ